jgi:copper-containing nitrite reductase
VVQLDTTHKIIEIAPGVKFSAWTFGDQVPGPAIRARVGDKIRFSMTNRSDETAPGLAMTAAPMMHSMDFHAAMVSPQDKYRSVAPGQTIEFEFTLNYPGIFMYHCGTPMILEHIASGMYGALIVEPRDGYPTKVDREYLVIQSEFYAKPDPDGRQVDGAPLYVLDGERLRAAQPNHTVFNGSHNGMVKKPLPAKPGERVRLFVLNVGPSKTSSFHVVGTILDRVWLDGNPDNQLRGMQTVLLGSSSSAIVEMIIPEAGSYIMVDHHFANASQGAIGLISTVEKPKESELEHHIFYADRRRRRRSQAGLREQVLRLPFRRRWQEARARHCRGHQASHRSLAHAVAEVAGQDAADRRRCQGDAQGSQRHPDAQSGAERCGNRAVHCLFPLDRRAARGTGGGAGEVKTARWLQAAMACAALLAGGNAAACGHCVEDRIAAVYDHALVQRARASKHQVAYFAWDGAFTRDETSRRGVLAVAEAVPGIDKGSVRVSMEPAAIAVAFDPRRSDAAAIATALRAALRRLSVDVVPLHAPASSSPG